MWARISGSTDGQDSVVMSLNITDCIIAAFNCLHSVADPVF